MSITHTVFDEVIIGSPFHIRRTMKIDLTFGILQKGWLTVKENPQQPDDQALIKKSIISTPSADGEIMNAGGTGVGEFVFHLLSLDTSKFVYKRLYYVDIWLKQTLDEPAGTETGIIRPHFAVTLERT